MFADLKPFAASLGSDRTMTARYPADRKAHDTGIDGFPIALSLVRSSIETVPSDMGATPSSSTLRCPDNINPCGIGLRGRACKEYVDYLLLHDRFSCCDMRVSFDIGLGVDTLPAQRPPSKSFVYPNNTKSCRIRLEQPAVKACNEYDDSLLMHQRYLSTRARHRQPPGTSRTDAAADDPSHTDYGQGTQ
jgi:hypothetical protein